LGKREWVVVAGLVKPLAPLRGRASLGGLVEEGRGVSGRGPCRSVA
jgi:hypothetical protein